MPRLRQLMHYAIAITLRRCRYFAAAGYVDAATITLMLYAPLIFIFSYATAFDALPRCHDDTP